MKNTLRLVLIVAALCLQVSVIHAQEEVPLEVTEEAVITEATLSAEPVLPTLFPDFIPTTTNDFTKEEGFAASRLEELVRDRTLDPLNPTNFLQHAIARVVDHGISATTVVFVILFPFVACLIAFSRHVIGLSGLSMYAPAGLAVALLSLGIIRGTILFAGILLFATLGKKILSFLKLPYLPRTAMILWVVSFGVFGLLFLSTFTEFFSLSVLNIFALLILILLSESFLEIQTASSPMAALQRVLETFVLGIICAIVLSSELIQTFVILYPELAFLLIGAMNLVVGKYIGLRLTEWLRFRQLADEQE